MPQITAFSIEQRRRYRTYSCYVISLQIASGFCVRVYACFYFHTAAA